jgi:hypothetical protein
MAIPGSFQTEAPKHTIEKAENVKWEKVKEEETIPRFKEWDPTSLPDDFFLVLEGKRRTGKSTFAKWLLQYYQENFALVWCMTNTKASGYWQEFVGEAFTFDSWYPSAIWKLIQRNDEISKKFGQASPATKKLASALVILDDVISSKLHDDSMLTRLAVEGRHHHISVILMTQDPKAIGPKVRDNCDVAVIFNQKTFRNKESVWADFLNDTLKDEGFRMLTMYCQEHDALVAVQSNLTTNPKKSFFKSTGDKTQLKNPHYTLGSPEQKEIIVKERAKHKEEEPQKKRDAQIALQSDPKVAKYTHKELLK